MRSMIFMISSPWIDSKNKSAKSGWTHEDLPLFVRGNLWGTQSNKLVNEDIIMGLKVRPLALVIIMVRAPG